MSKKAAAQAVAIICSAYGQTKIEQEAFQRLAVTALEDYPDQVLVELVNPKTGIISESKFPPTIAELHNWCRARVREIESERQRDAEVKRAIEARREREAREKEEILQLVEEASQDLSICHQIIIEKAIAHGIELPYEIVKAKTMVVAEAHYDLIDQMPHKYQAVALAYAEAFQDGIEEVRRKRGGQQKPKERNSFSDLPESLDDDRLKWWDK